MTFLPPIIGGLSQGIAEFSALGSSLKTSTQARLSVSFRLEPRISRHSTNVCLADCTVAQMVTNLISGYIPGRITMLCLNLHLYPRPIWMSRHGESEFNLQVRLLGLRLRAQCGRDPVEMDTPPPVGRNLLCEGFLSLVRLPVSL